MASQAAIFAETIAGMKKAIKRKAYDSDSDSSIEQLTNRGNKLRKRSRFVREGQLAPPTGPAVYRKKIEHAGFHREVISRKPRLVDEDGYDVESEDDDERAEEAMTAAAEMDPYSGIHIEQLLAPLVAASELPNHPTLSKPFTSKTLTELTQQAGNMVQKERASLWRVKHLLTRLSGDSTWIPCGLVETEHDYSYFLVEQERQHTIGFEKEIHKADANHDSDRTLELDEPEKTIGEGSAIPPTSESEIEAARRVVENVFVEEDAVVEEARPTDNTSIKMVLDGDPSGDVQSKTASGDTPTESGEPSKSDERPPEVALDTAMELDAALVGATANGVTIGEKEEVEDVVDDTELPAPHRMTTRAQAQAVSENTPSGTRSATPDYESQPSIHPYFLAPRLSMPDRDIGLPPNEAEEMRRLLQLYIQKQEEVCRGAEKVYNGLLRADRHRKKVLRWAKAEAHVGLNRDMSDGEDWYDKEEWGLDEDLKKGQDEDEEDAATTAKKTRTRRQ